jgi:tetratricopeptide (TPR) repeat protein
VEALPEASLLGNVFQGFGLRSRIEQLEAQIIDNPSVGNYEELGELYWDQKQFARAREAFDRAIAARSDSLHSFYRRALCARELGDLPGAITDLERVVRSDSKFDYYRAAALLGDAYARSGQYDRAEPLFTEAVEHSTTPETLINYACFLKAAGRPAEAREWTEKLMLKKRTMPRYFERRERPWFRKGKALLKELGPA